MENQTPTMCLPSSKQLAIINLNQNILPPIINNQPPTQPDHNPTQSDDEETGHFSCWRKLFPNLMEEFHRNYTTEQLLITIFYWIMSTTGLACVVLGFELLEETCFSSSVSPTVMSLFKYSLAIFASLARVDVYHPPLKTSTFLVKGGVFGASMGFPLARFLTPVDEKYLGISYYISDVLYMSFTGGFSCGLGEHRWLLNFGLYWLLHIIVLPIVVRFSASSDLVMVISIFGSFIRATSSYLVLSTFSAPLLCFLDKRIMKLLPVAMERVKSVLKKKKMWTFIKYAIGLVGTLVFQNFFRLTTFGHVKAFMYLATSWLTNLALINVSNDFGILNFLLGNVILGSTVSQSGFRITTWFTYAVCLFLYTLNFKLKSMKTSRQLERLPRPPVIFWIFYCYFIFDCVFYLSHHIENMYP